MPGHGIRVDGNDLLLDPVAAAAPARHARQAHRRCASSSDALVQVFGSGTARPISPSADAKNHIYWRGGQLAFGKLTMTETDLELVDEDPRDAFDFSVDRWNEQLVAGYSKTTADEDCERTCRTTTTCRNVRSKGKGQRPRSRGQGQAQAQDAGPRLDLNLCP